MADGLWLAAALASCALGMGWLALAMKPHWQQLRGPEPLSPNTRRSLRGLGSFALAGSLVLCLCADHASMAVLVWIMCLAASAQLIAFTLAWRPRWLGWLVAWARPAIRQRA